jgi:hypothetical protein
MFFGFVQTVVPAENNAGSTKISDLNKLPDNLIVKFSVTTKNIEKINNKLLGYNILHYHSKKDKDFVRTFNPVTIRFPDGVWANFYDWKTDRFTYHEDTGNKRSARFRKTIDAWNSKFNRTGGINGLVVLNTEKKEKTGKGFDFLHTFNINYDSPDYSAARVKDMLSKGLSVEAIELGNEPFWLSQVSTEVLDRDDWVHAAKAVSRAVKAVRPEVQISVPLSWRDKHDEYNSILTEDTSYFDAISLHKYSGVGDAAADERQNAEYILASRIKLSKAVKHVRSYAPGKPVWISEWGTATTNQGDALSALAMADSYLYLFENQDIVTRANWFSVNGIANSFITFKRKRQIKYPLEKTAYGCIYEIVRDIYEDAQLLECSGIKSYHTKTESGDIQLVTAGAVKKNNKLQIIIVNWFNKSVEFQAEIDGKPIGSFTYDHNAVVFKDENELKILAINVSPLEPVKNERKKISLPGLSVSVISLKSHIRSKSP